MGIQEKSEILSDIQAVNRLLGDAENLFTQASALGVKEVDPTQEALRSQLLQRRAELIQQLSSRVFQDKLEKVEARMLRRSPQIDHEEALRKASTSLSPHLRKISGTDSDEVYRGRLSRLVMESVGGAVTLDQIMAFYPPEANTRHNALSLISFIRTRLANQGIVIDSRESLVYDISFDKNLVEPEPEIEPGPQVSDLIDLFSSKRGQVNIIDIVERLWQGEEEAVAKGRVSAAINRLNDYYRRSRQNRKVVGRIRHGYVMTDLDGHPIVDFPKPAPDITQIPFAFALVGFLSRVNSKPGLNGDYKNPLEFILDYMPDGLDAREIIPGQDDTERSQAIMTEWDTMLRRLDNMRGELKSRGEKLTSDDNVSFPSYPEVNDISEVRLLRILEEKDPHLILESVSGHFNGHR